MSERDELQRLIAAYHRRLLGLKEKKARLGFAADVSLDQEIEEIETELELLKIELAAAKNGSSSRRATSRIDLPEQPLPFQDRILYEKAGDVITSQAVTVGDTTYAVASILSVSMVKRKKPIGDQIGAIIFGFVAAAFVAGIIAAYAEMDEEGAFTLIVIAGFIGAGLFEYYGVKERYAVQLRDSSGEHDILVSTDKARVKNIVQAISQALAQRR